MTHTRVISIFHYYKDRENSSKLTIDEYPPSETDEGYVEDGYYYVSISKGDQRLSMKLSEQEMALLAIRAMKAVESHAVQYMDVQSMMGMKKKKNGGG